MKLENYNYKQQNKQSEHVETTLNNHSSQQTIDRYFFILIQHATFADFSESRESQIGKITCKNCKKSIDCSGTVSQWLNQKIPSKGANEKADKP